MQPRSHTFSALGTQWTITTQTALSSPLLKSIHRRIDVFDQTYSRFRDDSLITKMAHNEGTFLFPDDAGELFSFYRELYVLTSGSVTPLIGGMLEEAGYDANYSFIPHPLATLPRWDDVMQWDGKRILHTTKPLTLDFGAAGKGYLIDILCRMLEDANIDDYVVDGSGDLRHKGSIVNVVGLEHPNDVRTVVGSVEIRNRSICASATNRRTWGGLHHIFDPSSKLPVQDIIATWVVADKAMVADGIATALFFVDPAVIADKYDYEYVRMHASGAIDYSINFSGQLY